MSGASFAVCSIVSFASLMAILIYLDTTKKERYALKVEREKTKRLKMELEAGKKDGGL